VKNHTVNTKQARLASNLAALALILGCAGCATNIPPYYGGSAAHARGKQAQGLLLKADPFSDKERAETYFKVDPADKGIAIIHLRAENQSADATWLLTEQQMALVDNSVQSSIAGNQGFRSDRTAADTMAVGSALLISPLLSFASLQLGYTQSFIEKNFVDKEWRNQTLSPGQSAEGFIYGCLKESMNELRFW
jgi:hypothetical protein